MMLIQMKMKIEDMDELAEFDIEFDDLIFLYNNINIIRSLGNDNLYRLILRLYKDRLRRLTQSPVELDYSLLSGLRCADNFNKKINFIERCFYLPLGCLLATTTSHFTTNVKIF